MRYTPDIGVKKQFHPKTKKEELFLLHNDKPNFTKTKQYLLPLITVALGRFEFSSLDYKRLRAELIKDVPLAVQRFLSDSKNITAPYKFCTYFTWYIAQRINKLNPPKKRKATRRASPKRVA